MNRLHSLVWWAGVCVLAFVLTLPAYAAPQSTQGVDGVWSSLPSGPAPGARREYSAVYDSKQKNYFIFGGFQWTYPGPGDLLLEVWQLSLDPTPTWTQIHFVGNQPGERASPQWGYDPARNRLIVFGGYGHHYPGGYNEYLNDVWELKLDGDPQWQELHPTGTPPVGRLAGAAVYDQLRQRFVGFGGTRGLPTDTWVLDLHDQPEWVQDSLAGGVSPPGSYGMTGIYDVFRDRMVMFGGSTSDSYYGVHNDVWSLDLSEPMTWTQLQPTGTLPSARRSGTSVHDLIRDRMVIYGGWDSRSDSITSFLGDSWALSFTPDLHWTQLSPAGTLPAGRDAMGAVYDAEHDRMVVFGGWAGDHMVGDTEFLDWGSTTPEPNVAASSQATPQTASLTWSVQGLNGERAAVYRRLQSSEWSLIGMIENNGTGTLAFQDHSVTAGQRYGYLVGIPSRRGAIADGEVWVDVPTSLISVPPSGPAFALEPVRPNPVVGRFEVSLSLVGDGPATLELVDVSGRLRASRSWAAGQNGPQAIGLGGAGEFAPGVYFLRLREMDRTLTRRVVITGS